MPVDPTRMLADLKELRALTGNENGAQRLAWTETWNQARAWLRKKLEALPGMRVEVDEAGNTWAILEGVTTGSIILGSHIDSVPNGGWLDGSLGVLAGLEVLRAAAERPEKPAHSLRLVAWAEEEGTQFGQSLFTARLLTGSADLDSLAGLTDREGARLVDVTGRWGVDLTEAGRSRRFLEQAGAYLELHIEQGPVLEKLDIPLAAVVGAMGVERHSLRFSGQTAHAGSTPMAMRRDALAAAARFALAVREIAIRRGGVGTVGSLVIRGGIVTAVAGEVECSLDQRHLDPGTLAGMLGDAKEASLRIANEERVEVEWTRLYQVAPAVFDARLVDLCAGAIGETLGQAAYRMPSGPLHDAVEILRAGVPSAMMFVQSLRGLSHTREEDTREEDLSLALMAFARWVEKVEGERY